LTFTTAYLKTIAGWFRSVYGVWRHF